MFVKTIGIRIMKNPWSHEIEYDAWLEHELNEMSKAFHGCECDRCESCHRIAKDMTKVEGKEFCPSCYETAIEEGEIELPDSPEGSMSLRPHVIEDEI